MLTIQNLSKKFSSGLFGVSELSISIKTGVLGLLGANGAGKTTLMQMIATLTNPTSGSIEFQGVDIIRKPDYMRERLGYLPQDFGVYDNLTAFEFLSYFAALKGVSGSKQKSRVMELLELVNLHEAAHRSAIHFSGGMKQRLGIAQALINNPDIVIVDEPTAGLDPEERVRFRNILSDIGYGKLVILSTHIVSDIESIASHIAIMKQGKLISYSTPEALLQSAERSIWKAVLSSEEFDIVRSKFKISNAVRKSDGVHIRIVSPDKPFETAVRAEPDLEDAFMYMLNFHQQPTEVLA